MGHVTKVIDPDAKGMLNQRIRGLKEKQIIPHSMIELLDQVRLFGNSSMHKDDFDPHREDCESAREFSFLFLTYAFAMPDMVEKAKNTPDEKVIICALPMGEVRALPNL